MLCGFSSTTFSIPFSKAVHFGGILIWGGKSELSLVVTRKAQKTSAGDLASVNLAFIKLILMMELSCPGKISGANKKRATRPAVIVFVIENVMIGCRAFIVF